MSLLPALIVKNSDIFGWNLLIFLKTIVDQTWKAFNTEFGPQSKDQESSYWVRQFLALFCIVVALTLGWNCVKGLRVTKIVKQIKFKGVRGQVRSKKLFAETTIHKILETNSSFYVKQCTTGKVQFLFFSIFFANIDKKNKKKQKKQKKNGGRLETRL